MCDSLIALSKSLDSDDSGNSPISNDQEKEEDKTEYREKSCKYSIY